MKNDRDFERVAAEWLDAGSDTTPPHVIDAILLAVRTTPQERDIRIPWRNLSMRNRLYAVSLIAVLAFVGIATYYAFNPRPNVGSQSTPTPSIEETQAPSPTTVPNDSRIDTTGWTTYQSDRYGFAIGHPPDWTVSPAETDWVLESDADDWLSTGHENFVSPDGRVRVSAWSVALDPDRPMWVDSQIESWANVEAWVEDYCEAAANEPCNGIADRAVPLCLERRDCHPGVLVSFREDIQAFFTNGSPGAPMIVVAIWRPVSDPSAASYGGSRQLLEAFLSTMCVWPEDARPPFGEPIAGC